VSVPTVSLHQARTGSNGPWPCSLPTTHRATWRAGWRALVSRIPGRVSGAPCGTSCPEPPERIPTPQGQASEGATPLLSPPDRASGLPVRNPRGVAPSLALSESSLAWSLVKISFVDLSTDLHAAMSIDLAIARSISLPRPSTRAAATTGGRTTASPTPRPRSTSSAGGRCRRRGRPASK